MPIRANPCVRILIPGPVSGRRWLVENLLERRRYSATPAVIFALVACFEPQERSCLAETMQSKIGLTVTAAEQIIQRLIALSLLVSVEHCELDERIGRWTRTRREWASWGWPEAVEYHLTTYDYPFMEMGDGTDRKRMDTYSSAEVDRDRQKSYVDAERLQLPSPHERLAPVPMAAPHRRIDKQPLNFEVLASMLTLTFAEIERIKPKWSDAPLMRRTSPSGGARHPTGRASWRWAAGSAQAPRARG